MEITKKYQEEKLDKLGKLFARLGSLTWILFHGCKLSATVNEVEITIQVGKSTAVLEIDGKDIRLDEEQAKELLHWAKNQAQEVRSRDDVDSLDRVLSGISTKETEDKGYW